MTTPLNALILAAIAAQRIHDAVNIALGEATDRGDDPAIVAIMNDEQQRLVSMVDSRQYAVGRALGAIDDDDTPTCEIGRTLWDGFMSEDALRDLMDEPVALASDAPPALDVSDLDDPIYAVGNGRRKDEPPLPALLEKLEAMRSGLNSG